MYKFLTELANLMDKHDIVDIIASDEWQGYPETGQDIQICIQGKTDYIELGDYIDSEKIKEKIEEILK